MRAQRRVGMRLGWRWFTRPADSNRGLRRRRILAAACVTWVALLGATLWQANDDRAERGRAQQPRPAAGVRAFDTLQTDTPYHGDVWTTIFMGDLRNGDDRGAFAPPGVPTFLTPGTTYVSPAVRRAMAADADVVSRVPGRIVGTIGADGLQSPDQYLVYTGADPGRYWRSARGWGSQTVEVPRQPIPRGPLIGTIAVLMGLPSLLLARATGRMSAISRQRSLAACHLLGVPARTLTAAAAVDAVLCAAVGTVGGVAVSILTVIAVHHTTVFGIEWFTPATVISPPAAAMVVLALSTLVAVDAARSTRRDLRAPWAARAGGPRPTRGWSVAALAVGVLGLAGVVGSNSVLGTRLPGEWIITYFYCGGVLATLGAMTGMPFVLAAWSRRLRRCTRQPTAMFVAIRRISWQRDAVAAACLGITLVGIASLVGAGTVADLDALSTPRRSGDAYALQGLSRTQQERALEVPAAARILQIRNGQTTDVAECPQLAALVDASSPGMGRRLAQQCRPGETFRVESDAASGGPHVVLPENVGGILREVDVVADDPATYISHHPEEAGHSDIIAFPGPTTDAVDRYVTAVMAVAPEVQVSNLTADSYAPMVPATRRLLVAATTVGLVTAAALLALCALDQRRRSRIDAARLIALGATRRLMAGIHAVTFGGGGAVALGTGLLIGTLDATVYDQGGGLVAGPGRLGVTFTALAVVITALAVLITWATSLPAHRGALSEDLRRE